MERGESGRRSYEISDTIVQSIQTLFAAVAVGLPRDLSGVLDKDT